MTQISLFTRYWLFLAVVGTLPIVTAGFVEGLAVYWRGYDSALERQQAEARRAALIIEGSMLSPLEWLGSIATLPWDYPLATAGAQRGELRRLIRQFPLIDRVQRLSSRGEITDVTSQDGTSRRISEADKRAIAAFEHCPSDRPTKPLLIPRDAERPWSLVFVERGTGGRLVADLRTSVVNDFIPSTRGEGGSITIVIDRNGTILAHPDVSLSHGRARLANLHGWEKVDVLRSMFPAQLACNPNEQRPDPATEGTLGEILVQATQYPAQEQNWFAAYRTIPRLDWAVITLVSSEALHAELGAAVRRTVLIVVGANLVALLLASILARQMSRPLASLAAASHLVAEGDLTARADVLTDDDIGRLSRQFNAMVDQLSQSYATLERRVEEKTSQLELASRHKSEFLAQMSHELRTPLNAIIGYAFALRAEYFGALNQKQQEYVEQVQASSQHLLALINDLLDLAKIEAGRMELKLGSIPIGPLIESSLALLHVRAQEKSITVASRIGENVGNVVADERKLKQIVVNLLSNAVKFTPQGGRVELAIHTVHDVIEAGGIVSPGFVPLRDGALSSVPALGWLFRVSDNGIGIAPEKQSQLFMDFAQLAPVEGTGLGLALSQRLAVLHGTEIFVESVDGRGSTFWFVLPDRPWPAS